jgi:hypothetical protein
MILESISVPHQYSDSVRNGLFQKEPFQNGTILFQRTNRALLSLSHMPNWHNIRVFKYQKESETQEALYLYLIEIALIIYIFL